MASPPQGPTIPFALRVGALSFEDLAVLKFHGREQISRGYAFDVTCALASGDLDETTAVSALFEREATLRIAVAEGAHRLVRGVVTRLSVEGVDGRGRRVVRVRIAPRLSLLTEGQQSRIFQDRSLSEILAAVLGEHGAEYRFALLGAPPRRTYTVQHRESDLALISRLCAEDGVLFWFEQPTDDGADTAPEVVVFGDRPKAYPPIPGDSTLAFRAAEEPGALGLGEGHVTRFSRRRAAAPRGARVRGYDFERPRMRPEGSVGEGDPRRVFYEHHDHDERTEVDAAKAKAILEQTRAQADIVEGTSACRRLSPGHVFTLTDHDLAALNGDYVLTRVEHEGHDPNLSARGTPLYEARFRGAPAEIAVRPRRPRRTARQVLETATVVGPPGQEIYTDAHGRVKVQFHWDLVGKDDERSSCWLRVAQAWAGPGWGFQFIPRVGMEVLVGFLGCDLDRPVVTGALYNATHPPSFKLPEAGTKSGVRTQSTLGGGGFNELSFEDRVGAEQIHVRAQRDLTETVEHDHAETIGRDKTVTIGGQHVVRVQGDRDERIAGALVQAVAGGARVSVSGDAQCSTQGSVAEEILENRNVVVHGTDTTTVLGESTMVVEGPHIVRVDAEHTLLVGEGRDDGQAEVSVSRKYLLSSGSVIRIRAEDSIVLSAGDSAIELTPRGIVLSGKVVELRGSESLSASGRGLTVRLDDEAEIVSRGELTPETLPEDCPMPPAPPPKTQTLKVPTTGTAHGSAPMVFEDEPPRLAVCLNMTAVDYPDGTTGEGWYAEHTLDVNDPRSIEQILAWIDDRIHRPLTEAWAGPAGELHEAWDTGPEEDAWARALSEVFFGVRYGGPGECYFGGLNELGGSRWDSYLFSRIQRRSFDYFEVHKVTDKARPPATYLEVSRYKQKLKQEGKSLQSAMMENDDPAVSLATACQHMTTYGALSRGFTLEEHLDGCNFAAAQNGSKAIFNPDTSKDTSRSPRFPGGAWYPTSDAHLKVSVATGLEAPPIPKDAKPLAPPIGPGAIYCYNPFSDAKRVRVYVP